MKTWFTIRSAQGVRKVFIRVNVQRAIAAKKRSGK